VHRDCFRVIQRYSAAHLWHVHVDAGVGAKVGRKELAHGAANLPAGALKSSSVRQVIPRMNLTHFGNIVGPCKHVNVSIEAGTAVPRVLESYSRVGNILGSQQLANFYELVIVALEEHFICGFRDGHILTISSIGNVNS